MKAIAYKNLKVKFKGGEEIILKNEIAKGAFANIYSTNDPQCVAKISNLSFEPSKASFQNEWRYFENLCPHANLITFWGAQEVPEIDVGVLLLENCPKGSLVEIMKLSPKQQLSEQQVLRVILQVAHGLEHIHAKGLVHRDIKLENILLAEDGNFKICDLGSVSDNLLQKIGPSAVQPLLEEINRNTTPMYRSPEQLEPSLFRDQPLAEKVDIFALGVLGYILCFKKPPFESSLGAISSIFRWPEIPATTDEFKGLLSKMLSVSPSDRPSAVELITAITQDLKFDEETDGKIDSFIFAKDGLKEAKASWYQILQSKITGAFFDTQGWIVGALQVNEYGPKQEYLLKLLQKAWKKPQKVDKFYNLLSNHWKKHKINAVVNLKMLILLHNYFKKGPSLAVINAKPEELLSEVSNQWKEILKGQSKFPKDLKRTQFTIRLIINYTELLREKLKLQQKYSAYFEGNFSPNPFIKSASKQFQPIEPQLIIDLFAFLNNLLKFVQNNLLLLGQLWNMQACIALCVLDEMFCILCLSMHLYRTFKLSTNFNSKQFDQKLLSTFFETQDFSLENLYNGLTRFFHRCTQITETTIQFSSLIPSLPSVLIQHIKDTPYLNDSFKTFNVFQYFNYSVNICGLKLPLSLDPNITEALASSANMTASSTSLFNSLPLSKKMNPDNNVTSLGGNKLSNNEQNGKQNGYDGQTGETHIPNSTQKKSKYFQQDQQQLKIDDVHSPQEHMDFKDQFEFGVLEPGELSIDSNDFLPAEESEGASNHTQQQYQQQHQNQNMLHQNLKTKNNKQYLDSQKPIDPFDMWKAEANHNEDANNVFSQFQSAAVDKTRQLIQVENNIENYSLHPSHPTLIQPDKQQNFTIPVAPKEPAFNVDRMNESLRRSIQDFKELEAKKVNELDDVFQNCSPFDNYESHQEVAEEDQGKSESKLKKIIPNFNPFDDKPQVNELEQHHYEGKNQLQGNKGQILDFNGDHENNHKQQQLIAEKQQQKQEELHGQQADKQLKSYEQYHLKPSGINLIFNGSPSEKQNINRMEPQIITNNTPSTREQKQLQNSSLLKQQQSVESKQTQQQQQSSKIKFLFVHQDSDLNLDSSPASVQHQQSPELIPQSNQFLPKLNGNLLQLKKQGSSPSQSIPFNKLQRHTSSDMFEDDDYAADDNTENTDINQQPLNKHKEAISPRPAEQIPKGSEQLDYHNDPQQESQQFQSEVDGSEMNEDIDTKGINPNKQEQIYQNHSALINYIRDEVSSEFYSFIVDISEVNIGVKIGSGCSCDVYKGECRGKSVAIKAMKLDNSEESHLKEFQREIAALIKLKNHQNLLQLVAISSHEEDFYIITEFCEGGTLFDLLHRQKKKIKTIPWKHKISWLIDIAKGMAFLHQNSLIHRDLKSLNLLFDKVYEPDIEIPPVMKIADFGLTKVGTNSMNPHVSGVLGTFHWMAPEIMRNQKTTVKADVYSFAIVMWELSVRQTPFKNLQGVVQVIKFVADEHGRPDVSLIPKDTPLGLKELMVLCWDEDPTKRPSFEQIIKLLHHPEILALD